MAAVTVIPSASGVPLTTNPTPSPHPWAWRPTLTLSALLVVVLVAFSAGYGYHRDELYFLVAGGHLDWAYADQGPLTPLIARLMNAIAPGSLTVLRIPPALMAGGTVMVAGALTFELGGTRRARVIAAACTAAASVTIVVGHLLSTTTFDLLAWATLSWLVVRAIRTGAGWHWALAGLVAGIALLNKPLIAFLLAALAVGLVAVGPRRVLRSGWLWAGVVTALLLWAPWLVWQAAHGWPQIAVSSSIANGGSASSQPRWALLPYLLLLVSPVLAPIWIAGLIALLVRARLRMYRAFAVAWIVLFAVFTVLGGKPYYLAGMFPVLLAAGAIETDAWVERGRAASRRTTLTVVIVVSALVSAVIGLPLLPAQDAAPVVGVNPDAGETIGWPDLVREVASVYRGAPGSAVIFTANYGEAGAIDRYGPALGLPAAYSGHNAFAEWGPPPDRPGPVVVVGFEPSEVAGSFQGCSVRLRVSNSSGIDNDEHGAPIDVCSGTRAPWSRIWSGLAHLG